MMHAAQANAGTALEVHRAPGPGLAHRHILAVRRGSAEIGGADLLLLEPDEATLLDPWIADNAPAAEVLDRMAGELLSCKVGRHLVVAHGGLPSLAAIRAALDRLGFTVRWRKLVYSMPAEQVPTEGYGMGGDVCSRDLNGPHDRQAVSLLERVFRESPSAEDRATDAESFVRRVVLANPDGTSVARLWEIAYLSGRPVGLALRGFLNSRRNLAGNYYVGVLPEARGRGLGAALHVRGLRMLAGLGARRLVAACDPLNLPARRLIARLGYTMVVERHFFLHRADTGRP